MRQSVKVYIGEPTGQLRYYAKEKHWGAVITPHKKTSPYPGKFPFFFVDNGAFAWWKRGEPFNEKEFFSLLERIEGFRPQTPDFVVIPDLIAGGKRSIDFSLYWYEKLKGYPYSLAFVVQDGMEFEEVKELLRELPKVKVLFVGGTLEWKLKTGAGWTKVARELGITLHVGRVGTAGRVCWAKLIGAHSIDSSLPLFSRKKLRRFERALAQSVLPFTFR